ncbi:hypothetical protein LPJ78_001564 [Coemansia sp. RSA 989]|nr:hypothetical protein LPJ78_001564 [Coemansia sp. RSA 989]
MVASTDSPGLASTEVSKDPPQQHPEPSRRPACRFFSQPQGCRNGANCRFAHSLPADTPIQRTSDKAPHNKRNRKQRAVLGSLRKQHISDLLKAPQWTVKKLQSNRGESAFAVEMPPSDPDFPYDLACLHIALVVPDNYPPKRITDRAVEIHVANQDIPANVCRSIEKAFAKHVRDTVAEPNGEPENKLAVPSLEDHLVWLDRSLEQLLQQKPAATMKFVSFAGPPKPPAKASAEADTANQLEPPALRHVSVPKTSPMQRASRPPVARPTRQPVLDPRKQAAGSDSADAASSQPTRRSQEIEQLQRRFRSSFKLISDSPESDTVIKLEIVPTDPDIRDYDISCITGTLTVSRTYPQADASSLPIGLSLDEKSIVGNKQSPSLWQPVGGRARYLDYVCYRFNEHVKESSTMSLLQHLNWLDRWLVSMIATPLSSLPPISTSTKPAEEPLVPSNSDTSKATSRLFDEPEDKPWIHKVTLEEAGLPANIANLNLSSEHSISSSDDSDSSSSDSEHIEMVAEPSSDANPYPKPLRRGIEIRFGIVKMANVSLVHCHSFNCTVRCLRCKSTMEVMNVAPTVHADRDHQLWKACDTCSTILGVRFRPDWMFTGSTTLGYLDCSGCTPFELLPSKFTLSCEPCMMSQEEKPADTVGSVGIASMSTFSCRNCFARLSLLLQEPQFVRLQTGIKMGGSSGAAQISKAVANRKKKPNRREELLQLGVVPGQPLPKNGTCKHFGRSNRWMRFPCCGKAYPCVTCHDDKEDHDHEYAQTMLCGFCAKEQRISKAEQTGLCVSCGGQVIKKVDGNHAFWQGGKGVRDQQRMSRKDTKKYQGLGKTISNKKVKK